MGTHLSVRFRQSHLYGLGPSLTFAHRLRTFLEAPADFFDENNRRVRRVESSITSIAHLMSLAWREIFEWRAAALPIRLELANSDLEAPRPSPESSSDSEGT